MKATTKAARQVRWWVLARCSALRNRRAPDRVIGRDYLCRWYLIPRNRLLNVYLHYYTGSDDDRALHDHPWPSVSWLLRGILREHDHRGSDVLVAGSVRYRSARYAHRLELVTTDAMTLFVTGPRIREWGFWCPQGWRHWRDFVDPTDHGKIGRGCE